MYKKVWCHMNFPWFSKSESETLDAREMTSIIPCCPPSSRKIAYGSSVLIAFRFETTASELPTLTMSSSFSVMRLEILSTRTLILGQKCG